jgi:hypothetical protein
MMREINPPLITPRVECWGRPRLNKLAIIEIISTINVTQYAQGLSVHNPQATMNVTTPRARGIHPNSSPSIGLDSVELMKMKMPLIIAITAEMNNRIAMMVMPRGRFVVLTFCIISSVRESVKSTVDDKETKLVEIT